MTPRERLREAINDHGIFRAAPGESIPPKHPPRRYTWQFNLRRVILDGEFGPLVGDVCWDVLEPLYAEAPFQLTGIEGAGVPLVMTIQAAAHRRGMSLSVLAFRKQYRDYALFNCTEGRLTGAPLLLVDDFASTLQSVKRAEWRLGAGKQVLHPRVFVLVEKIGAAFTIERAEIQGSLLSVFTIDDFDMHWAEYEQATGRIPEFGRYV